jgi:hypothetical protein
LRHVTTDHHAEADRDEVGAGEDLPKPVPATRGDRKSFLGRQPAEDRVAHGQVCVCLSSGHEQAK